MGGEPLLLLGILAGLLGVGLIVDSSGNDDDEDDDDAVTTPGEGQNPDGGDEPRSPDEDRVDNRAANAEEFAALERDVLTGTDGADLIEGTDEAEEVIALGGGDTVWGNGGADLLSGGPGDDALSGGDGNDSLQGADGDDELRGGTGDDTINGGSGDDDILGRQGNDILVGNEGDDALFGSSGDDVLYGGDGDDQLSGGFDTDRLEGGKGDDTLEGVRNLDGTEANTDLTSFRIGDGDQTGDVLLGDEGADRLILGSGDWGTGGEGGDEFVVGDWIRDGNPAIIRDFEPAVDTLKVGYSASETAEPGLKLTDFDDGSGTSVVLNGIEIAQVTGAEDLRVGQVELFDRDAPYPAPEEVAAAATAASDMADSAGPLSV